jgi:hypothetical protein
MMVTTVGIYAGTSECRVTKNDSPPDPSRNGTETEFPFPTRKATSGMYQIVLNTTTGPKTPSRRWESSD